MNTQGRKEALSLRVWTMRSGDHGFATSVGFGADEKVRKKEWIVAGHNLLIIIICELVFARLALRYLYRIVLGFARSDIVDVYTGLSSLCLTLAFMTLGGVLMFPVQSGYAAMMSKVGALAGHHSILSGYWDITGKVIFIGFTFSGILALLEAMDPGHINRTYIRTFSRKKLIRLMAFFLCLAVMPVIGYFFDRYNVSVAVAAFTLILFLVAAMAIAGLFSGHGSSRSGSGRTQSDGDIVNNPGYYHAQGNYYKHILDRDLDK